MKKKKRKVYLKGKELERRRSVQMCPSSSPAGGGAARQALFGSDYMYCVTNEPSSIN
jgi:hypothetical protein